MVKALDAAIRHALLTFRRALDLQNLEVAARHPDIAAEAYRYLCEPLSRKYRCQFATALPGLLRAVVIAAHKSSLFFRIRQAVDAGNRVSHFTSKGSAMRGSPNETIGSLKRTIA